MTTREVLSLVLLPAIVLVSSGRARLLQSAEPAGLPGPLERYISTDVRLTRSEHARLMGGAPVTKLLESEPDREVAVFGGVWIKGDPRRYVDSVNDIENFERGGAFRITRRISTPPRLEDFAELTLPNEDVKDLKSCRIGKCEVKVSEESLKKLRAAVNWNSPDATAQAQGAFRTLAFEYVKGYLEGGDSRLAVYRDEGRPRFVADEFRLLIDRLPAIGEYLPDLRRYLLDYPAASLAGSTDFLYWQEAQFGLKPTIRISHVVIEQSPAVTVVASKMLYASHYFWTALDVRVLVPDAARGPGFWFVMVSRSRSDGLSGFVGRMVRGRVRDEAEKGTLATLGATRARLETAMRDH